MRVMTRTRATLPFPQVFEDTPVGTVVYTLQGRDPEGSPLEFTISGDYFSVNRVTGDITLVKALDRETRDVINVVITISVTSLFLLAAIILTPMFQDGDNLPAVRRTIKGRKIRRVYSREAAGELVDPANAPPPLHLARYLGGS